MSRFLHRYVASKGRFPRVSGDEPDDFAPRTDDTQFSPRERG